MSSNTEMMLSHRAISAATMRSLDDYKQLAALRRSVSLCGTHVESLIPSTAGALPDADWTLHPQDGVTIGIHHSKLGGQETAAVESRDRANAVSNHLRMSTFCFRKLVENTRKVPNMVKCVISKDRCQRFYKFKNKQNEFAWTCLMWTFLLPNQKLIYCIMHYTLHLNITSLLLESEIHLTIWTFCSYGSKTTVFLHDLRTDFLCDKLDCA